MTEPIRYQQPATALPTAAATSTDYGRLLRYRRGVIVLSLLLGLLVGAFYLSSTPTSYTASSSVLVLPTGGAAPAAAGPGRSSINLDTEAQLVRSDRVLQRAVDSLGADVAARELGAGVSVRVPPNTEILVIDVQSTTAEDARRGSVAVAQAYLAARQASAEEVRDQQLQGLQEQIDALNLDVKAAAAELAQTAAGSPQRQLAAAERDRLQVQIDRLEAAAVESRQTPVQAGEVIVVPSSARSDSTAATLVALTSGGFAGLLVGLALALVLERGSRRIREESDVQRLLRYPVLIRLPEPIDQDGAQLTGRQAQAFLRLRNQLGDFGGRPAVTLLVASATPTVSTHDVAVHLVNALSQHGTSVTLHCLESAEAGETLSTSPLAAVASTVGEQPDVILVIHAPATSISSQAQTVASKVQVVLLVVEEGTAREVDLEDAAVQFDAVGAREVGIVLLPKNRDRRRIRLRSEADGTTEDPTGRSAHSTPPVVPDVRNDRSAALAPATREL